MKRTDLLSINEAAKRIGISRQALHGAVNAGRIQVVKVPSIKLMIASIEADKFELNGKMQDAGRQRANGHKGGRPRGSLKSTTDNTK